MDEIIKLRELDQISKNLPDGMKEIAKQMMFNYQNALISTGSVKGNLIKKLSNRHIDKHDNDDLFYEKLLHQPLIEIGRFRQFFISAMSKGDRKTAIQCLYNIVGRLPQELEFDFDDRFYHDLEKRYPSIELLEKLSSRIENAITKYTEFLINDSSNNWKQRRDRRREMARNLMMKRKRFAEIARQRKLTNYGQEPMKPKRICRFGHPIIVSTCKFHHREGTIDKRAKIEKEFLRIIHQKFQPKHWLKEAYTRFFWLDYKKRIEA